MPEKEYKQLVDQLVPEYLLKKFNIDKFIVWLKLFDIPTTNRTELIIEYCKYFNEPMKEEYKQ